MHNRGFMVHDGQYIDIVVIAALQNYPFMTEYIFN